LSWLLITEQEVKDQLEILNNSKPSGPDGVAPRILRSVSQCLVSPLTLIYCRIFWLKSWLVFCNNMMLQYIVMQMFHNYLFHHLTQNTSKGNRSKVCNVGYNPFIFVHMGYVNVIFLISTLLIFQILKMNQISRMKTLPVTIFVLIIDSWTRSKRPIRNTE
jgi:hypothetical protein